MAALLPIFHVWPLRDDSESLPLSPYVRVEGIDELDAAQRLLGIPLQRQPRSNMHLRALVRGQTHRGAPILLYAKEIV
jgi:hypothetical protein